MPDMWYGTAGSRDPKIVIIGEAWGAEEEKYQTPFCGQSGRELFRMFRDAWGWDISTLNAALEQRSPTAWITLRNQWLVRNRILLCNTIAMRPPGNDYTFFLHDNDEAKKKKVKDYAGIYPKPPLALALDTLWSLLDHVNPDLVITTGNWALHAITPHAEPKTTKGFKLPTGIAKWRGSQTYSRVSPAGKTFRVLPIIHPASILRAWEDRYITVHDLRSRAKRFFSGSLDWDPPQTEDVPKPTFEQVQHLLLTWLAEAEKPEPLWLSIDLETYRKRFIACCGICDFKIAMCIPFFYFSEKGENIPYWSLEEETQIWLWLKALIEHPNVKIIGQNFIYDTQYFHRGYCIEALVDGDTMIAHHVLFPGTPKDLARLASLYNHYYCYWKDESEEWAVSEHSAEELWKYNCKDVRATYEAWFVLLSLLSRAPKEFSLPVGPELQGPLLDLYFERIDSWRFSRQMTLRGMRYNDALRQQFRRQLYSETQKLETWLLGCVPENWRLTPAGKPWFTSSQHTAKLLYTAIGLRPVLHKKTRQPTTDDSALNELCERADCQWLAPMLEALREMRSALVYARNFLNVKLDRGRLTCQMNNARPETFRWSSSENAFDEGGNMQNVPRSEE